MPVDYATIGLALEQQIRSGSLTLTTIQAVLVSVAGELKVQHYRNASKPADPRGHPVWLARGWSGQVIAVVPEHRLVIAVASILTEDAGYIDGDLAWHLVADVVISALEPR